MMFDITRVGAALSNVQGAGNVPHYNLCLEDIDELVAEIFKVASRNPAVYLKMMLKSDAKAYLERDNGYV
jgi:hypothetical protein